MARMENKFHELLLGAQRGDVSVADIFAALRERSIDEKQCEQLLETLEKRSAVWRRVATSV